jgi:hypothetical protein
LGFDWRELGFVLWKIEIWGLGFGKEGRGEGRGRERKIDG